MIGVPLPLAFRLLLGLALSAMIGMVAYSRRSLSESGVLGAVLLGTVIFGFGGLAWGILLITFFITSTLLSRFKRGQKEEVAAEKFDKGSRRDFWQAMANAGVAGLMALLYGAGGYPIPLVMAAFIAALATANADTWATEIGVLAKNPPRLITTFKRVEPGTSGGVSPLGTLATVGGALLIGVVMVMLFATDQTVQARAAGFDASWWLIVAALSSWMLPAAVLGGLAGSLFDSFLGATVQVIYWSPWREKETEKAVDPNGKPNEYLRGWRWLNNDAVNFAATAVGALVGAGTWELYVIVIEPWVTRLIYG